MSKVNEIKKDIEDKTGSCTFCVLPWIHSSTETNGLMRLCCASNTKGIVSDGGSEKSNIFLSDTTISKEWNNNYFKNIREKMLKGEEPIDCQKCFQQEKLGIISKRLWETREWINKGVDVTNLDVTAKSPIYLDLRLGNSCNLKCVMCSPHDSSQWVKDYKLLSKDVKKTVEWNKDDFEQFWYKNESFKKDLHSFIPTIEQVQFAGGEPLMMPEHAEFIKEIIKQGRSKEVVLRYNTNGALITDEIIEIWKQFKQVKVSVSLDGIGEKGEYIRYPMNWSEVYNNLKLLDNTPDNIDVNLAVTIQLLNIKHLPDFAKWKIKQKFKKINLEFIEEFQIGAGIFNMHLLYIPTFLSIQALPLQDKEEIKTKFLEFKKWLKENYVDEFWTNPVGWQKWQSVLDYMDKEDRSNLLLDLQNYIDELDTIRKTDAKKTFPELAHLFS